METSSSFHYCVNPNSVGVRMGLELARGYSIGHQFLISICQENSFFYL